MSTKLGTLTLDLVARIGSFTQGMRQASTTADREMRRVENSVIAVDSLIKKLAVTAGTTFSAAQISGYADSYIGLQNRLKLVTTSQQELTQATNDTYKISQETAQSWDSTVQVINAHRNDIQTICYLGLHRFDADQIEFQFLGAQISQVTVPIVELSS